VIPLSLHVTKEYLTRCGVTSRHTPESAEEMKLAGVVSADSSKHARFCCTLAARRFITYRRTDGRKVGHDG
jgi:hypothetical protein